MKNKKVFSSWFIVNRVSHFASFAKKSLRSLREMVKARSSKVKVESRAVNDSWFIVYSNCHPECSAAKSKGLFQFVKIMLSKFAIDVSASFHFAQHDGTSNIKPQTSNKLSLIVYSLLLLFTVNINHSECHSECSLPRRKSGVAKSKGLFQFIKIMLSKFAIDVSTSLHSAQHDGTSNIKPQTSNKLSLIVYSLLLLFTVNLNAQDKLESYLKTAGENNTELKAKYLEYQVALEDVDGVGALPDPSISFGYFISPVETRVGPQQFKISATQMFPWFGTLSSKEDVAIKKAESKFNAFENYRNSLHYNVRTSYYKLYEWQETVEFRNDFLNDLDLLRKLVLQKYKTGGRMSDVLQLDIKIEEAKMQQQSVLDKKSSVESNFTRWLNTDSELSISIPDTLVPQEMMINGIVDSLLSNNLLLNQKDLDIEASNLQIKVANKSAGPQIGLGLDYVNVGERTDVNNLSGNGQDVLMPMVTLTIPIFNSRKRADKKIAQLNLLKNEAEKEQLEFTLKSALETAIFNYNDAIRKQKLAERQLELAIQTRSLIVNEYSTGKADIQELIGIYQKILDYKFAFAKAVTERNIAVAYLYNLVNFDS